MTDTIAILQLKLPEDAMCFSSDWNNFQCLPDLQPSFLCSVLQQHISDLQPLLEQLQQLDKGRPVRKPNLETAGGGHSCEAAVTHEDFGKVSSSPVTDNFKENSSELVNTAIVQIKAKKAEIDRRILAFIERKQAEINENNVREFCNVIDCNQENSCARTDAVFTPYPGFKSHIKVSRVVNTYGPQTRNNATGSNSRGNLLSRDCGNQSVEERLQNMEGHLRLETGGPVPKDIYQRIKKLEDKILELEGISPEYFQSVNVSTKRKKHEASQSYSLAEIDQKINALRQSLLHKGTTVMTSAGDAMTS
ncbi:MAP3K12-binding inhibitory protein 1 isoform X2 [Bombina bombina]|uniref:MAP3K12-binding inhibitory protein 1 isoform X2 n=1 Tax=Bombina bombina TaxID=8345 RepID=UPI00235AC8C9|nr:MAP3K12-binding inhibitory protein 1 isoform X2 [Bombina bombina]